MGGAQAGKVLRIVTEAKQAKMGITPDPNVLDFLEKSTAAKLEGQSTALFNTASLFDDGIIDPRDTRKLLVFLLHTIREAAQRDLKSNTLAWPASKRPVELHEYPEDTIMKLTQEHEALRRTARQFVEKELNPHIDAWEEEGIFPAHEVFKKMGDLGLLGICKPEENGGLGLDYSYNMVVVEELGRIACGGVPMAIGVQTDMATPALARFGSKELRDEFLTPAIAGDYVASIAVSEPHAGSDVAAIKTTARKDGDDYVISGTKMWITNSTQADFLCLLANTSDGKPHLNKSLIVVPTKSKGISFSKKLNKLGMRSSDTAQIFLDEVRVPQRYVIGAEGMGFTMQMMQFQEERMYGAANALGGMEACIEPPLNTAAPAPPSVSR
jgi:alkylation response protein AidB-like acyl-CoA dehydrogenase